MKIISLIKAMVPICLAVCIVSVSSSADAKATEDEWQFTLSPLFLWGVSIDGSSQIGPAELPLDLSFTDDILENMGAVFTVHFEARKKDLTLFTEYQYLDLEPSASIPNGPSVDIDFTAQLAEFGAGYRITTWGNTDIEPIIGARWTSQDIGVSLQIGGPSIIDSDNDWWDFFVGLRTFTRFNEKWTLIARGDIGGGGSDFVWNLAFMVDYKLKEWCSVFAGLRFLDYDYDSGSGKNHYAYDATQQGPLAGISFYW
jgi:hypothetical protein